jgi:hypothetical protein
LIGQECAQLARNLPGIAQRNLGGTLWPRRS